LALADDPDPEVRMQWAASLGEWDDPAAGRALAGLLERAGDPYVTGAALSSALPRLDEILTQLTDAGSRAAVYPKLISMAAATLESGPLSKLARQVARLPDPAAAAITFLDGIRARTLPPAEFESVFVSLRPLTAGARAIVRDESADPARRLEAISLLGRVPGEQKDDTTVLLSLLRADVPLSIRSAALDTLLRMPAPGTDVSARLLELRGSAGPALRARILDALLSRTGWTRKLLEQLQARPGEIATIDPARRETLRTHPDKSVSTLAASVFDAAEASRQDRAQLIESYREAAARQGDADKGETVFQKACASCHQLDGIGLAIGPDLATLGDRSVPALLAGILDPNRAVLDQYVQYVVTTTEGRSLTGIITSETASSFILKQLDGTTVELLRKEIASLVSTGRSMMPEGLEAVVTRDHIADLIAFLNAPRAPRKTFPAGKPVTIRPDATGALSLLATRCEIFGHDILLEDRFHNLGHWHGPDDRAVWTVQLDHPAEFEVHLDYACDDRSAGNRFRFEGGPAGIRGTVSGTGNWSDYRQ
ncbi:MAG: c-type cytochrome, partial [Akkermansiaceae bacterium]|nr:c-type cytochrome [Akkermansiaceae bacterium]